MQITISSITTGTGPGEWFTGGVYADTITNPAPPSRLQAASVDFAPGARTAWHTRTTGQTIYVLEGIGRCQRRGHRQDHPCRQPSVLPLAMLEVDASGNGATWGEHLTDEEYHAAPDAARARSTACGSSSASRRRAARRNHDYSPQPASRSECETTWTPSSCTHIQEAMSPARVGAEEGGIHEPRLHGEDRLRYWRLEGHRQIHRWDAGRTRRERRCHGSRPGRARRDCRRAERAGAGEGPCAGRGCPELRGRRRGDPANAREFGGLHLAVNDAGIARRAGLLLETGPEDWRRMMGINLGGVGYAMMAELGELGEPEEVA